MKTLESKLADLCPTGCHLLGFCAWYGCRDTVVMSLDNARDLAADLGVSVDLALEYLRRHGGDLNFVLGYGVKKKS